jgi:hypothetical protein
VDFKMSQQRMTAAQLNKSRREEPDQIALAELLDRSGLLWNHVPNEIQCKPQYYAKRKRLGVKKGVPDNFIYDAPPLIPTSRGAVIELKRERGGKVSDEQEMWIQELRGRGWEVAVCNGIDEAIEQLRKWGYLR